MKKENGKSLKKMAILRDDSGGRKMKRQNKAIKREKKGKGFEKSPGKF